VEFKLSYTIENKKLKAFKLTPDPHDPHETLGGDKY